MSLICRMIGHRRSIKQARRVAEGWASRCTFCDEPLIRRGPKAWQPAALAIPEANSEVPLPLFEQETC
jgi:hypothetical protein